MYEFITGRLAVSTPLEVVIDVAGVGYKIQIPTNVYSRLPQLSEELRLYTSFIVRETSQALYGFLSPDERNCFETFLGVSGVGPKMALGLLGALTAHDLAQAIQAGDTATLSRVPGVGKKTAERLVVEMRGKLPSFLLRDPVDELEGAADMGGMVIKDALSALVNLGYTQALAQKAVKKALADLPEEPDLGALITKALSHT